MVQTNLRLCATQNLNTTNVNFKASKPDAEPKKEGSKAGKIALAGLATAGAIGLALLAIKKGKGTKLSKEMDLEAFRNAGCKFEKGKALTKKGKPFSGTIISNSSKNVGSKYYMTYENGVLKSSQRKSLVTDHGYVTDQAKEYIRDASGKLEKIIKKTNNSF